MKRTDSFLHGFQKIDIQLTTNVDDNIMKALTPPTPSFLIDWFSHRKNSMSEEDDKPETRKDGKK
jgi:hypothetical protein